MTGTASDTATGVTLGGGTGTGDGGSGGNSGTSPAGNQPSQTGNATGPGTGSELWYGAVEDQGLRALAESKGWKNPTDALKSYKELETAYSSKTASPAVPKDASEYTFNLPQDLPREAYNDKFAEWFKGSALKTKLSKEQAAALHDEFVGYARESMGASQQQAQQALQERVNTAANELQAEWGKIDSPQFARNAEMARRAIRNADPGLMDALRSVGVLQTINGQDTVLNASVMKAFAKMGEGMYAEDRVYGAPSSAKNPFADDSRDLAMQGRFIKEDPDKAASLIRAAGKEKMFAQFLARHAQQRK